jgi:alkylation response protein AidB-like acyl-CoA dehydrogenase
MSEIQGGSDIPSNVLEAEPHGNHYRIFGNKFFCSAIHADYAVITAKVTGSEEVGTFIVPAWLPGNKEKEIRNGLRINRLKWKLGTAEVPTAEIDFDGALAYAVGPTDRGVANAVGIVLTLSRIAVGVSSAAAMIRAGREALLYSEFRDVFGKKICQFPLALRQVRDLMDAAQRATAGVFKIYDLFVRLGKKLRGGLESKDSVEQRKLDFNLRELIILQKLVVAYETTDVLRKAISLFGGHGVIEDFSPLPRLFRDAMVNELWEGPRNVLLMQVFRDLQRVSKWYEPREFVTSVLEGAPTPEVRELANELEKLLKNPPWDSLDEVSLDRAASWEAYCDALFRAYQEQALREVGKVPIVRMDKLSFPELWSCPEIPSAHRRSSAAR